MPNTPTQYPQFDLPGAEYFSLAPNASIALGGRRRVKFASTGTSAPATTNNVNNNNPGVVLETTFTQTSAIYMHYFFMVIAVSAGGMTLNNVAAGVTLAGAAAGPTYALGLPSLTSPFVNISTILLSDRDRFISAKDVAAADAAFGATSGSTLFLSTQLNVNNQTAGAITFSTIGVIIYTRLDGLTE